MKSLLLVIDMQKSFINENTNHLINNINNLVTSNEYDDVVFTKFINSLDSIWYSKLNYNGCMSEEDKRLVIDSRDKTIIEKKIYSSCNEELINYIKNNNISKIYLCGIDTECCVLKTAFDLFENGYDVYVLSDYCGCMYGESRHNNALEIMKRNIGVNNII